MILTDFFLQPDRGPGLRVYVEPIVGMMVRDPATGKDWLISLIDNSTQTMTLLRGDERRADVSYAKRRFHLSPGRNGEFDWARNKAA